MTSPPSPAPPDPVDPLEPQAAPVMQTFAQLLQDHLPAGMGFALLVFDRGEQARMNYISNAEPQTMALALRELVGKLEGLAP